MSNNLKIKDENIEDISSEFDEEVEMISENDEVDVTLDDVSKQVEILEKTLNKGVQALDFNKSKIEGNYKKIRDIEKSISSINNSNTKKIDDIQKSIKDLKKDNKELLFLVKDVQNTIDMLMTTIHDTHTDVNIIKNETQGSSMQNKNILIAVFVCILMVVFKGC